MSPLRYAGSISIPVIFSPEQRAEHEIGDAIPIENAHCTLLLPSQLKVIKGLHEDMSNKQMKAYVKDAIICIPHPPTLYLGSKTHYAVRDVPDNPLDCKRTFFIKVENQDEMQTYLDTLTDALGLPRLNRFFHVSVANDTGKPTDSIGDINAGDTAHALRLDGREITLRCEHCYFADRRRKVIIDLKTRADAWLPDTDEERTWEDYEALASSGFKMEEFAAFVVLQTIALEEYRDDIHNAGDCVCLDGDA